MQIVALGGGLDPAEVESALRSGHVQPAPSTNTRCGLAALSRYVFAGWTLDAMTRELLDGAGASVHLTSSEFDLLMTFVREPGRPLSRSALTGALRGHDWNYFDRSIDTLVARLRKKVEAGRSKALIRSVRGVGYVFCAAVAEAPAPNAASMA